MIGNIVRLIVSAILRFFSDKLEQWYQKEKREHEIRKAVVKETKVVLEELKKEDAVIAADPESIAISLDRLRDFGRKQREGESGVSGGERHSGSPFGGFDPSRAGRNSAGISGVTSEVSGALGPGTGRNSSIEQPPSE